MDLKNYAKQYGVSEDLLQQIIEDLSFDRDFEKENLVNLLDSCTCLSSLGLDIPTIKEYIKAEQSREDSTQTRIDILQKARKKMLQNMHEEKKALDCMDCILQELQMK